LIFDEFLDILNCSFSAVQFAINSFYSHYKGIDPRKFREFLESLKKANLIISEGIHTSQLLESPFLNDLDNIIVLDYSYSYERYY
jgi:hypothetical protein